MAEQEAIQDHKPRGDVLVEVNALRKWFPVTGGIFSHRIGHVKAVDGVSFYIKPGETLGLVGESGCGKTTTGRMILRLEEPTEGKVYFEGHDVFSLDREEMRRLRRQMQIVFQDPYSSLNPRMTVGVIVGEALEIHGVSKGKAREKRVQELLDVVGLNPNHISRYPHEFSGGQRQRIGVARALALNPKLIICDEPVSALDVSIQSHILNLLEDLQAEFNLTYLFIAHNLSVVKHISDRVGVMYLGQLVELCSSDELFSNPLHPYTEALMSAIPLPDPELKRERIILEGDVPSPMNPPSGCHFHTRCRLAQTICGEEAPPFIDTGHEHFVGCHLRKAN
ncbi:MAG: dipeptide ABC transporter ATP-binding protein [Bacillota bacterium]|nr:MAG: dipeptide ABC transporter ATP-binding protein [Bacillota bacterium]